MDEEIQRRLASLSFKDESIKALQDTLDSYREKCTHLDQEVEQLRMETQLLRKDMEAKDEEILTTAAFGV